jgi:hypothetical protein
MRMSILICLFFLSFKIQGQQLLWTTSPNSSIKTISTDVALGKILEYYDYYDMYYDGTGYSKKGFLEQFEGLKSYQNIDKQNWEEIKNKLLNADELIISAVKVNEGIGSMIYIFFASKKNIDYIYFADTIGFGGNLTTDKDRFKKWIKSIL